MARDCGKHSPGRGEDLKIRPTAAEQGSLALAAEEARHRVAWQAGV